MSTAVKVISGVPHEVATGAAMSSASGDPPAIGASPRRAASAA